MRTRASIATALFVASISTGCGSAANESDAGERLKPDIFYSLAGQSPEQIENSGVNAILPESLPQALPNAVSELYGGEDQGGVDATMSAVVVQGKLVSVEPGEVVKYGQEGSNEDADFELLDFYEGGLQNRTVRLTIEVGWFAGRDPGETVSFRVGARTADPAELLASARGLMEAAGVVAILADRKHSKYEDEPWFPLFQAGLVGTVDSSGVLRFPGLGDGQAAFARGIDTVAELREQAEKSDVRFVVGSRGASPAGG